MAELYALFKCYDLDGDVVATHNLKIKSVRGGFATVDNEPFDWVIEELDYPWEVLKVTCELLGMVTKMPMPHWPEIEEEMERRDVNIRFGSNNGLVLDIRGRDEEKTEIGEYGWKPDD